MKFLAVALLASFAAVRYVRSEECTEETAEVCIDSLLSALLDDSSEEEVCRELGSSVDCLKEAVDECLGHNRDSEVDEGLQELEKLLRENCNKDGDNVIDEDDEIEKCFQENEHYIIECVTPEEIAKAMSALLEKGEEDENLLKCARYGRIAECLVERVREKCGDSAATMADKEMSDPPADIAHACSAVGESILEGIQLLEEKRK